LRAAFGIPDDVIKDAATQLKQSSLDAIDYLRRIKREAEAAEAQRQALEEERAGDRRKIRGASIVSLQRASATGARNSTLRSSVR
jgi:hypothetical protein